MKIAIITDGNTNVGLGHIYQSMTLAKALQSKQKSVQVRFFTQSSQEFTQVIQQSGFELVRCKNDEDIFKELGFWKPERIVFDKLDLSPELAQKAKSLGVKLTIMTCITKANNFADIVVLSSVGNDFSNIHRKNDQGQIEFFGPKYWLMRSEFDAYRGKDKPQPINIENIMLMFGGADPLNFSAAALNEILKMDQAYNVLLVLGAAFTHESEVKDVIHKNTTSKSKIKIVTQVARVAELMHQNDVVLASPGLSFFESLVVGTPVVGFHQNEIQRRTYKGFVETFGKEDIFQIPIILKNKRFTYPTDPQIVSLEIGEGKGQIVDEILK